MYDAQQMSLHMHHGAISTLTMSKLNVSENTIQQNWSYEHKWIASEGLCVC